MGKTEPTIGQAQKKARRAILARYAKTTGKSRNGKQTHSWRQLGSELGFPGDYLRQVTLGRRKASIKLLQALNIKPDAIMAIVNPCKKCGQVHQAKRCTHKKTFEENAKEYDEWLANPETKRKLAELLEWAEKCTK